MRKPSIGRRRFLKQAAVTGAALAAVDSAAPKAAAQTIAREADPAPAGAITTDRPGGDFMVDVFKSLDFEFVAANPGSSFRGLHESLINYGGNTKPELITCCHEESSVAMAHGYYKVEGKPMMAMVRSEERRVGKER